MVGEECGIQWEGEFGMIGEEDFGIVWEGECGIL